MVRSRTNAGFALIEVVIMVLVLGILSAVAVPAYVNLQQGAKQSAEDAVVANVRTGISLAFAQSAMNGQPTFPVDLDQSAGGPASDTNQLFTRVLQQDGVTRDWSKEGDIYLGPTGTSYRYDKSTGKFAKQ